MTNLTLTKYYIHDDTKKIRETYNKKEAERYAKAGFKVRSRRKKPK